MSVEDRRRLTGEEAAALIKGYVRYFWTKYSEGLRNKDREDVEQDIYLKLAEPHENTGYDPDWKPGEPIKTMGWVTGDDGAKSKGVKNITTEYMLEPGYNPEDPYDPNFYLPRMRTFSYLDKYDGRRTSKKIYVMGIVDNNMQIMAKRKEVDRYAQSLDQPMGDSDDDETYDNTVASDDYVTDAMDRLELREIISEIINSLSNGTTGHEASGAVGWSPLTGRVDAQGNKIETAFTERDAALHLLNEYPAELVATFYHRVDNGNPITKATVNAKYTRVKEKIKSRIAELPDGKKEVLRSFGFRL